MDPRGLCLHLGILSYTLSALFGVAFLFSVAFAKPWISKMFALIGFLLQTGYLAVTWLSSGVEHRLGPVEAQFAIIWLVVFSFSMLDLISRTRYVVSFVMPAVALFSFAILFFIPGRGGEKGPWDVLLATHVTFAMLGYAAFIFAFVVGLMYLAQVRQLKTKRFQSLFERLPALDVLDRMNLGSVVVGLVALTLAIVFIVMWGLGHGTYSTAWWLDPRILSPTLLWLFYVGLLLIRLTATVRGKKVALLTVFGFVGMIVLLIGMSVAVGLGPHPTTSSIPGVK